MFAVVILARLRIIAEGDELAFDRFHSDGQIRVELVVCNYLSRRNRALFNFYFAALSLNLLFVCRFKRLFLLR